ncbi:YpmS family protein [Virgibacillus soli]|uniref:YpmS family protein n=1 Tax=Paracerasibacillus soli TaxID=480284 RepID=UPI0035EB8DEF
MKRINERKNRKWKRSFVILLLFNVVVLLVILSLIFWPVREVKMPSTTEVNPDQSSEFIIRTTKKNLNDLVNAYIEQLLKNTKHHYEIILGDDVLLLGELPVFSSTVPLTVHFEPLVQDNGDVILKQKSISIGFLELPNKKIMEYMKKYLPVPKWVVIDPKNEEIYVAVTDMDVKSNFHVSVDTIDLEANNIALKLKVPYETLGIETVKMKD